MSLKFLIRSAGEEDFPALIKLFQEFAHFEKTPEKMVNSVEKMMKEKKYFNGFVAENAADEIIGYTTYFFSYHTWIGKSLYMDDLYVKPSYRRKGIGKKLLDAVIAVAKKENCSKVRWQVSSWNKHAQAFYRSMGAEISDVEFNCDLMLKN